MRLIRRGSLVALGKMWRRGCPPPRIRLQHLLGRRRLPRRPQEPPAADPERGDRVAVHGPGADRDLHADPLGAHAGRRLPVVGAAVGTGRCDRPAGLLPRARRGQHGRRRADLRHGRGGAGGRRDRDGRSPVGGPVRRSRAGARRRDARLPRGGRRAARRAAPGLRWCRRSASGSSSWASTTPATPTWAGPCSATASRASRCCSRRSWCCARRSRSGAPTCPCSP